MIISQQNTTLPLDTHSSLPRVSTYQIPFYESHPPSPGSFEKNLITDTTNGLHKASADVRLFLEQTDEPDVASQRKLWSVGGSMLDTTTLMVRLHIFLIIRKFLFGGTL